MAEDLCVDGNSRLDWHSYFSVRNMIIIPPAEREGGNWKVSRWKNNSSEEQLIFKMSLQQQQLERRETCFEILILWVVHLSQAKLDVISNIKTNFKVYLEILPTSLDCFHQLKKINGKKYAVGIWVYLEGQGICLARISSHCLSLWVPDYYDMLKGATLQQPNS